MFLSPLILSQIIIFVLLGYFLFFDLFKVAITFLLILGINFRLINLIVNNELANLKIKLSLSYLISIITLPIYLKILQLNQYVFIFVVTLSITYILKNRRYIYNWAHKSITPLMNFYLKFSIYLLFFIPAYLINIFNYGLIDKTYITDIHPDNLNFETIGNSIYNEGVFSSQFSSLGSIKYHWYSYFLSSSISNFFQLEAFVSLLILTPILLFIGISLLNTIIIDIFNQNIYAHATSGLFSAISVYLILRNGSFTNFDSLSQTAGYFLGLGVVYIVLNPKNFRTPFFYLVFLLTLCSIIAITKSSYVIPIIGGLFGILINSFRLKSQRKLYAISITVALITSAAIYLIFIRGNISAAAGLQLFSFKNNVISLTFQTDSIVYLILFILGISPKFLPIFFTNHINLSNNMLNKYIYFSTSSILFTLIFLLFVGDESRSNVNLMWFLLATFSVTAPLISLVYFSSIQIVFNFLGRNLKSFAILIFLTVIVFLLSRYAFVIFVLKDVFYLLILFFLIIFVSLLFSIYLKNISLFIPLFLTVLFLFSLYSRFFSLNIPNFNNSIEQDSSYMLEDQKDSNYIEEILVANYIRSSTSRDLIVFTNIFDKPVLPAIANRQFYITSSKSQFSFGGNLNKIQIKELERNSMDVSFVNNFKNSPNNRYANVLLLIDNRLPIISPLISLPKNIFQTKNLSLYVIN
jgi:hypothetical protein